MDGFVDRAPFAVKQVVDDIYEEIVAQVGHHEHIYPLSDGEGGAGAPVTLNTDAEDETNGAASTQD